MKIVNPWGTSGSQMNPYLRAAIVFGTGIFIGGFGADVLPLLPRPIAFAVLVACCLGVGAYLICTQLWFNRTMKQLEVDRQRFEEILRSQKHPDE